MEEAGLELQAQTYMLLIRRYKMDANLEMALKLLFEMEGRGIGPRIETAEDIVMLAVVKGHPRLAIDLAENYEATSVRRLDSHVWVKCLIAASETFYVDGVVRLWDKVVRELKLSPDEGVCLNALHTAGRFGLPDLATDIIRKLKDVGASLQEYHFAPVIEALCRENRIKEALALLSVMRSSNTSPTAETAHPIFTAIQNSTDAVDTTWTALEELRAEGHAIDITALNVVIQASIFQGDLQRAVGIYQFCAELQVAPTIETYNVLLSGCIAANHRELGDRFIADMKEAKIKPDAQTYERLIVLCLTGRTYEDAFFYLEEMKAEGYLPPQAVYEAIIRRCVAERDERYHVALAEMREFGYEVTGRLESFIGSGGTTDWVPKRRERASQGGEGEASSPPSQNP
ncbi:hypothetical protein FA95DRAFT_1560509 [Auriscalpium vulgare]|uniref:Uncharacterized protein n=1 Tax=Auriscalpium vulgare TaxID=40419 RepID=A0ACB8RP93_9AGAM|nr:hypothetical protein FA95DRAFT_1560509 [Auriscalpium vulgare]